MGGKEGWEKKLGCRLGPGSWLRSGKWVGGGKTRGRETIW